MKDPETIMKEHKLMEYNILNNPDPKRSVFLEGLMDLEILINHIISVYFFGYREGGKVRLTDPAKDFEKNLLYKPWFGYKRKLELLKNCELISPTKFNELKNIGEERNKAAHRRSMQINEEISGWYKGSHKERNQKKSIGELIINDDDVEQYKKKCADCYAYLMVKVISLYNPDREDLKID